MTPTQSRQLASLVQTFSPKQKADFYYFTMVLDQDPLAYLSDDVQMLKVSFGGDRSEAGRYAANQRWQGQKKLETSVGFTGTDLDSDGEKYSEDASSSELNKMFQSDIFFALEQSSESEPAQLLKKIAVKGIIDGMTDVSEEDVSEACLALFGTASNLPNHLAVIVDKQRFVQHFVDQWAGSSNDSQRDSLLVQRAVEKVFGLVGVLETQEMESEDSFAAEEPDLEAKELLKNPAVEKVLTSFLRAQYANTQSYFKSKGIKTVEVLRGAAMLSVREQLNSYNQDHQRSKTLDNDVPNEGNMEVWSPLRPLSSWSISGSVADDFAGVQSHYIQPEGVVFRTRVPVSRVFATPFTGIGCANEYEMVLLGGRIDAKAGTSSGATESAVNYTALYGEKDQYS